MTTAEQQIKDYINNFYKIEDLKQLAHPIEVVVKDDTLYNDNNYLNICQKIFNLLNNSSLSNKYRIEIDQNCTSLIQKLFKAYVNKDTFIVTSSHDHQATTNQLGNNKRYIVNIFDTFNNRQKVFKEIISAFKESNCKSLFCIMVSTAPQATITIEQEFFVELKTLLVRENIDHLMILDDCQSIFMIERNYEIFDGFLATGHVLSSMFPNLGILFTKLPKKIGYINKQVLNDVYPKLDIICKYKDKAKQFNGLINNYFSFVLENTDFSQYRNEAPHQFAISLPNTINHLKYDNKFIHYGIRFNPINCKDNFVRVRYHELIIQDPDNLLKGLKELKLHLNKLSRFKEIVDNKLNYDLTSRDEHQDLDTSIVLSPVIQNLLTIDQKDLIFERFLSMSLMRSR